MILFIDTSDSAKATVALIDNQKLKKKIEFKAKFKQAELLLKQIEKLNINLNKLKGIIVIIGPGSFTALRIGATVANTLSWSLKIPVVGIKQTDLDQVVIKSEKLISKIKNNKFVIPHYGKEPNITKSKK
ncbi:tRNA (adenosine(37)-N6)-threonylcarbamoyltransferase complex dimerization subunit type 1 TsaB [Patescibacteria group bacterium]|nr:tRNA (adenosine(37)-N6)-threonylcarbamoyltransferase complex dimerization subunit type 1 TsaB [Patescibacteria group bacterium]